MIVDYGEYEEKDSARLQLYCVDITIGRSQTDPCFMYFHTCFRYEGKIWEERHLFILEDTSINNHRPIKNEFITRLLFIKL